VVLGVDSDHARSVLAELYAPFVRTGKPILFMDVASAELTKYAPTRCSPRASRS
jgi:UDPglucose 6-dehydrogenase